MTEKQKIYKDMLYWTLPQLRNMSTLPWWRRLWNKAFYLESEFIHNLPQSMYDPEFVEHDVHFLNKQAKNYYEQCDSSISPAYDGHVARIKRLFELVPEEMKSFLTWEGPTI